MGNVILFSEFLPDMRRRRKGHVVNITSVMERDAVKGFAVYAGTKHFWTGEYEDKSNDEICLGPWRPPGTFKSSPLCKSSEDLILAFLCQPLVEVQFGHTFSLYWFLFVGIKNQAKLVMIVYWQQEWWAIHRGNDIAIYIKINDIIIIAKIAKHAAQGQASLSEKSWLEQAWRWPMCCQGWLSLSINVLPGVIIIVIFYK